MKSMRCWQVQTLTEDLLMQLVEIPKPEAGAGEYLVRVEACGVNFLDLLTVRGKYQVKPPLPFTPGVEIVGTIVATGSEIEGGLVEGIRVAATCNFGGYAEFAVASSKDVVPIGQSVPAGVALALRSSYCAALHALRNAAQLKAGETLLVLGATGATGSAAVSLGKVLGARVIAAAGGPDKLDACRQLGAQRAIDYHGDDWIGKMRTAVPEGVNVTFDPVGGQRGIDSMRLLARHGRYVVFGFAGEGATQIPGNRLLLKEASAIGVLWGEARRRRPELGRELLSELFALQASGDLALLESTCFPFNDAPEALRAIKERRTMGKVLLRL